MTRDVILHTCLLVSFLFVLGVSASGLRLGHAEEFSGKEFFVDSFGRPVFASYEAIPAKSLRRLDVDDNVHHASCVEGGLVLVLSKDSSLVKGTNDVVVGGRRWSCSGNAPSDDDNADFIHHRISGIVSAEDVGANRVRVQFVARRVPMEKLFEFTKLDVRIGLSPAQERKLRSFQSKSLKSPNVSDVGSFFELDGLHSVEGLHQLDASQSASVSFGWNYEDGAVKNEQIELYKTSWWQMTCDHCYVYMFAGISAKIETSWGRPVSAQVKFDGSVAVNFDYTLVFGNEFKKSDYTEFYKMDLGTVVIPIGGVPVTVTPYMTAGTGYNLEIGGDITIKWGANYQKTITVGYDWDKDDGVSKIYSLDGGLTLKEPEFGWEFSAKGEAYLALGAGVKIWGGVADMRATLYPGIYISASKVGVDSLGVSLSANVDIGVKGSIGVPKVSWLRYDFGPIYYYSRLYRDSWTYTLPFGDNENLKLLKAEISGAPRLITSVSHDGVSVGVGKTIPRSAPLCPEVPDTTPVFVGRNDLGSSAGGREIFGDILCGYKNTRQLAFVFTAAIDGLYEVNTTDSDFDTILSLRTPTLCGRELTCNDDLEVYSTVQSRIVAPMKAGDKRILVVGGYNNASGNVVLNIRWGPPSFREIFVDDLKGNDNNNGSVGFPLATLKAGVELATVCPEKILRIVLLPGTHSIPLQIDFNLFEDNEVTVQSVFGAAFGYGSAVDTVIDCSFMGRFAFLNDTSHVTFRGLTIQNCRAQNDTGGALKLFGGVLRAEDVHFTWNFVAGDPNAAMGGAVSIHNTAEAIFIRCLFDENSAEDGGALAICENGKAELSGVRFKNNQAARGGAVFLGSVLNSTYDAGAVFDDCSFDDNSALFRDSMGGAIFSFWTDLPFEIHNCNFTDNWAVVGGAIFSYDAGFVAENCNFERNAAWDGTNSFGFQPCGGAVAISGVRETCWANITHSFFRWNTGILHGGAVCVFDGAKIFLEEDDLDDNLALPYHDDPANAAGGGVWCEAGHVEIGNGVSLSGNTWNPVSRTFNNTNFEILSGPCTSNWADCNEFCSMCYECKAAGCDYPNEISCDDDDQYTIDTCDDRLGCVSTSMHKAPSVQSVSPGGGPVSGGTRILITGSELGANSTDVANVKLMGQDCIDIQWVSSTQLYATTPEVEFAGASEVKVVTRRGGGGESFALYQYLDASSDARLSAVSIRGVMFDFYPAIKQYVIGTSATIVEIDVTPMTNTSVVSINGVVGPSSRWVALIPKSENLVVVRVVSDDQRYDDEYSFKLVVSSSGRLALGWVLLAVAVLV